jgi:hypothetical protein
MVDTKGQERGVDGVLKGISVVTRTNRKYARNTYEQS